MVDTLNDLWYTKNTGEGPLIIPQQGGITIQLSSQERETIILFNEGDQQAECFTYNKKMISKLTQLAEQRPDQVRLVFNNQSGGIAFSVPKKWIKINPGRTYTPEQRAKLSERMKNIKNIE